MKSAVSGELLTSIPLGTAFVSRYDFPYLVVHRADLVQVLAKACEDHPDVNLHLGHQVMDAVPHPNGITAMIFHNGQIVEYVGKMVIAADGVWSKFRTEYVEQKPARYSGQVAWRGLIPAQNFDASRLHNTEVWLSPQTHAITYPVRTGRYLNVVITHGDPSSEGDLIGGREIQNLREATRGWHSSFTEMLDLKVKWNRWPIYEVPVARRWAVDRLALIGDAAHAMSPHAAQGAAMAIEDALVLTRSLVNNVDDIDRAFRQYERDRKSRVAKTAALGWKNRRIFQMRPPLSNFRDFALRNVNAKRFLARQDWLYSWRG